MACSASARIQAATTHLLDTQAAPEHATDLIDLHLAQAPIRSLLDAAHQQVPAVLVTDHPAVLLQEATQLLDALPVEQQSQLHEVRMLLARATAWTAVP